MVLTAKSNNPKDNSPVEYICDLEPLTDNKGEIVRFSDGTPRNVSNEGEITFKNRLTGHKYGMFINPQDANKIDKQQQFRIVFDVPVINKK